MKRFGQVGTVLFGAWVTLTIVLGVFYGVSQSPPFLIMLLFGVGYLILEIVKTSREGRDKQAAAPKKRLPMTLYVANEAMKRAAKDNPSAGRHFALADIGVLAYTDGDAHPKVHRRESVGQFARYIRPFVGIHKRGLWATNADLHFVLLDGGGNKRFESRVPVRVGRRVRFHSPDRWLPISDGLPTKERVGRWALHVSMMQAGKLPILLGVHPFRVKDVYKNELARPLDADGEIDPQALQELEGQAPISLSKLLNG